METMDNEILQALSARKSVRVYTDEPVTEAERDAILQAAFQAPTAVTEIFPVFPVHFFIMGTLRISGSPKTAPAELLRPVSGEIFKTFCGLLWQIQLS